MQELNAIEIEQVGGNGVAGAFLGGCGAGALAGGFFSPAGMAAGCLVVGGASVLAYYW